MPPVPQTQDYQNPRLKRGGGEGAMAPHPNSIFEPKNVQEFQFQKSGILDFTGVQKLYGPEISRFLPCMIQVLDNLQQLLNF